MTRLTVLLAAGISALALSSAAQAADLIIEEPIVGVVEAAGGDWEGAYIGAHVGYGWGLADHTSLVPGNDLDLAGFFAGVQAGANFYLSDGIVGGIEGDVSWANITGTDTFGVGTIEHTINWMGSVRGKLGFDAGAFMPYLTAGLAFANATRDVTTNATAPFSNTHVGWTAGAGVDVMVTEDVSLNLEYRYSDLGEQVYDTGGIPPTIHLTTHTVRAGFNWHF